MSGRDYEPGVLTLEEVGELVAHLMADGSRSGLLLANRLNMRHGASARRMAAKESAS